MFASKCVLSPISSDVLDPHTLSSSPQALTLLQNNLQLLGSITYLTMPLFYVGASARMLPTRSRANSHCARNARRRSSRGCCL